MPDVNEPNRAAMYLKHIWTKRRNGQSHNSAPLSALDKTTRQKISNEILPFAKTWMEVESKMLSKRYQLEKDKYHMISLICAIKKQKKNAEKKIRERQSKKQI